MMPAFARLNRKVVSAKAPRPSGAGSAISRICSEASSREIATRPAVGSLVSGVKITGEYCSDTFTIDTPFRCRVLLRPGRRRGGDGASGDVDHVARKGDVPGVACFA